MNNKNIYIVGIEGAGTSALAEILVARGAVVSGSDDGDGFYRQPLRDIGITVYDSFDIAHIPEHIDYAIYSTAFDESNVEIAKLKEQGVRTISYPEAVAEIFNKFKNSIAICGTHGKTTTTALTAEILRSCGLQPVALVGSQIVGWNGNALTGKGEVMVLEADEYQNKLQYYNPKIVVLTSVDYDHPDFFSTPESYRQAFIDLFARIPKDGMLIICGDSVDTVQVAKDAQPQCPVIFYGSDNKSRLVIKNYDTKIVDNLPVTQFVLNNEEFTLNLPGEHNALNATAAILVAQHFGCSQKDIQKGLSIFRGALRRFESHGLYNEAVLIDDYAHHPTEVQATLKAVRGLYPQKNIIAAFHPHTFTRTKALLAEFAQSFGDANEIIVIDIYGSAREEQGGISSQDLVSAINENKKMWAIAISQKEYISHIQHIPEIKDLAQWAQNNLTENDVFITLGAGDIWKVHKMIKGSIA